MRLVHLTGVRFEFAGRHYEQDEWHIVARVQSRESVLERARLLVARTLGVDPSSFDVVADEASRRKIRSSLAEQ